MKKKTCIAAFLFSIFMLACTACSAAMPDSSVTEGSEAESAVSYEEMYEYLQSVGSTEEFLNLLPESAIESLYDRLAGKYVRFAGMGSEAVPQARAGQIDEDMLTLTITVYEEYTDAAYTTVSALDFECIADWNTLPFWHLQDAMTFNWDESIFSMNPLFRAASIGYFYKEGGTDTDSPCI